MSSFFFVSAAGAAAGALGYRAAMLAVGAGGFVLAGHLGWPAAFLGAAALLAAMLSLNRLFATDHQDGTLEQMALSSTPLSVLVGGKVLGSGDALMAQPLFALRVKRMAMAAAAERLIVPFSRLEAIRVRWPCVVHCKCRWTIRCS